MLPFGVDRTPHAETSPLPPPLAIMEPSAKALPCLLNCWTNPRWRSTSSYHRLLVLKRFFNLVISPDQWGLPPSMEHSNDRKKVIIRAYLPHCKVCMFNIFCNILISILLVSSDTDIAFVRTSDLRQIHQWADPYFPVFNDKTERPGRLNNNPRVG